MTRNGPLSFLFGPPKPPKSADLPEPPLEPQQDFANTSSPRSASSPMTAIPAAVFSAIATQLPPTIDKASADDIAEELGLPYTILPVRGTTAVPPATPPKALNVPSLPEASLAAPAMIAGATIADPPSAVRASRALLTPVFIVGSPRSGTSILIDGLMAAGYTGYREGNFLSLMRMFETAIERHRQAFGQPTPKVLAGLIDWDAFRGEIFQVFKRHVDALNPAPPWMDKSGNPEMIEAIPNILTLWPSAVFIFAKRRAIENIVSRLKKFPGHTFEYHCRDWARNMAAWRAIREVDGVRGIEIDQQDIARTPEKVATRLADFLGAAAAARDRMRATFANDRPQQTNEGSAARVWSLDSIGWTSPQRESFAALCGTEMEQFGYSVTDKYWADGNAE